MHVMRDINNRHCISIIVVFKTISSISTRGTVKRVSGPTVWNRSMDRDVLQIH